ncbi:MAG: TfoX/Sxy family protein [Spirochaetes bacterium]|nr:TfoX/Sxy family protein [Spirochaetota bacterium]
MAVSESYREYVIEQLEKVRPVTYKKMFGGVGLYSENLFFALISGDVLYFKTDDSNRGDFEALDMEPFRPYGKKSYAMQYYEVPIDVLEDPEKLSLWMNRSLDVARKKSSSK